MRRICYLHIGLPKTATTTIQHALRKNQDHFSSIGILVPQTGLRADHGGHNGLALSLCGAQNLKKVAERFQAELNASNAETVVMSSEMIARRLLHGEMASSLFANMDHLNLEPRLIVSVRNQPQLFNSAYCQLIKCFRLTGSFAAFLNVQETTRMTFNSEIADVVASYGAPLTVLKHGSDVLRSFLSTIGVLEQDKLDSEAQRMNKSVGPLTIEVAREVQNALPQLSPSEATRCWRILKRISHDSGLADFGFCGITSEVARKIEREFSDANNIFAQRVWGCSWSDAFTDQIGQEFLPNDFQITGVPNEAKAPLKYLTENVHAEFKETLANS